MRLSKAAIAGAGGAVAATALALVFTTRPSVAIAGGGVVTVLLVSRFEPIRPYAIAGTFFVLLVALGIETLPVYPVWWSRNPFFALAVVGGMSALVLVGREFLRVVIRAIIRRVVDTDETGERVGETASAVVGALALAWWVLRVKERLIRSGVTGLVVPTTFALDVVGIEYTVPWFVREGVDIVFFLFVGGLVVGFHTITSWHAATKLKDDDHVRQLGRSLRDAARSTDDDPTAATAATDGTEER
jgi:hypothetical protein